MFSAVSVPPPLPRAIPGLSAATAAAAACLPAAILAAPTRRRRVARARQFAVYLHHFALGASISACARLFARDRATVRNALARIERLRDDPTFDCCATRLHAALAAQRDMISELIAQGAAQ